MLARAKRKQKQTIHYRLSTEMQINKKSKNEQSKRNQRTMETTNKRVDIHGMGLKNNVEYT